METIEDKKDQPSADIKKLVKKYNYMKKNRDLWCETFDFVAEFYDQKQEGYSKNKMAPQMNFKEDNYTSQPSQMVNKAASSFMANLFSTAKESIRISPSRETEKLDGASDFFQDMTRTTQSALDDFESGFAEAKADLFDQTLSYGTAAIYIEPAEDIGSISADCWTVDNILIDVDIKGLVKAVAYEDKCTVENAVEEYGLENLSDKTQSMYNDDKLDSEVCIVHLIYPNPKADLSKKGNQFFALSSVYFEPQAMHIIKSGGYKEMPAPVARPFKKKKELFGRSPAIEVSADTYNFNVINSKILEYFSKNMRPPLAYEEDALVNDTVDDSEGGLNPVDTSKIGGRNPFFPLFTFGDMSQAFPLRENIINEMNEAFLLDRLLDFNSTTPMTLGEANMRRAIRFQGIAKPSLAYIRFFSEVLVRVINILYRQGAFGLNDADPEMSQALKINNPDYPFKVIPPAIGEAIVQGKDFYKIEFLTPAARQLEDQTFMSAVEFMGLVMQFTQMDRNLVDNFNGDALLRDMYIKKGLPLSGLNDEKKVKEIRKQKQEIIKMQMQGAQPPQDPNAPQDIQGNGEAVSGLQETQVPQG